MTETIITEGLTKRFGETEALSGVDLSVPPGTVLGLLGPNGAGKTTMVRILATLLRPDAGRALVCGHDVVRAGHQVRSLLGLTGQEQALDESLTGRENLLLVARLLGLSRTAARNRTGELLGLFRLDADADRAVKTWSGGMRRRLDLAASLVGSPRVLFLDEPTNGLDPRSRVEVWGTLRALVEAGTTILLTTQYLDEADRLADRIAVIDHGRLIAAGTPDELKARTGTRALHVRPIAEDHLDVVRAVVAELSTAEPHVENGTVTVGVRDPGILAETVRRLDLAGVLLAELVLRPPSLDEAFLALTSPASPSPQETRPA